MQLLLTQLSALPVAGPIFDGLLPGLPDPFLAAQLSSGQIMGFSAIVCGFLLAVIITVSALFFQHRKRQMWHETARMALEKGQPLPPMPPTDEELDSRPPAGVSFTEWQQMKRAESRGHDLKGGLVLIAVGAGIQLFAPHGTMIGAIPAFIGVALLIYALIERFTSRGSAGSSDRKPQP